MSETIVISRRNFIIGAGVIGAGLSVGIYFNRDAAMAKEIPEVNAWVHIGEDDIVTIRIARSEMGQGTLTGLAQLVAEELECDWSKVVTEYPTPGENLARDRVWGDFATGGSRGVRHSHQYMREGGAAARMMLVEAAAQQWGASIAECQAENSLVTHIPSGRQFSYGQLAVAAGQLPPPLEITLKDPADWKLAGKSVKRLDTVEKLTGKQIYGADVNLPGMVHASIKACPVRGGTLESFDTDAIADMRGVIKVVRVDDTAVAVVADSWWRANQALEALPIKWNEGVHKNLSSVDINALLDEGLTAEKAFPGNQQGDIKKALSEAKQIVEATYNFPYQNHATMEPMNATALYTAEACTVWCPTQDGEAALAATAEASGLPITQCDVHKLHLGGGFGRRGGAGTDYVKQAVSIAKQMPSTPVKLLWSREEDMQHGFYHPITKGRMRGSLDADGNLTGLHLRISGQSILAALMPARLINGLDLASFQGLVAPGTHPLLEDQTIVYDFPNLLIDHAMRNPPVRPGFWRGVNVNQNAIYLECFMDEMAEAAKRDPLEFRLSLMENNPKAIAVLKAVAEKSGWRKNDGLSRGLAHFHSFGSYVAACAEVTVSDEGALKIHRIVAATDPGIAVNPQQIEAQVEGSFVYGLSALLYGEITLEDGKVQEHNFDTYDSLRIAEMPEVETIVMPSGGFWGGVGEPTISVAAPAVLNAIFAATGKRMRNLPIKDQDLRAI